MGNVKWEVISIEMVERRGMGYVGHLVFFVKKWGLFFLSVDFAFQANSRFEKRLATKYAIQGIFTYLLRR